MSDFDEDDVLDGGSEGEEQKEYNAEEEDDSVNQIEPCSLTQDVIGQGLSLLCRTGDGLSHAFVKLDLRNRNLTDIVILSSFVHLRYLNISSNYLTDLSPLAALTQLLWLKGDANHVQKFISCPPYLQWLSLAFNRLTDLEGFDGGSLEILNFSGNGIQRVSGLECHRLTNMVTLELRGNVLETTDGIYLPNLRHLYLAQNKIKRLEGLKKLERLTTLHLRDNHLETLDGISSSMKSLRYLNVRGNLVSSEKALRHLMGVANTLHVLVLADNPLSEKEDYRLSVLILLPLLERLDKEPVSSEDRAEAQDRIGGKSAEQEDF